MIRLLDTNIFAAALNQNTRVLRRLEVLDSHQIILCSPVLAELEFGAQLSSKKQENLHRIRELTQRTSFQSFNTKAARRFGELKATLRRRGITIADFDLAIAAIALESDAVLVSDDRAFYENPIEGLRAENWLKGS